MSAREFKKLNPALGSGVNQRDLADVRTLYVLDTLETKAAAWIEAGIDRMTRRALLRKAYLKLMADKKLPLGVDT